MMRAPTVLSPDAAHDAIVADPAIVERIAEAVAPGLSPALTTRLRQRAKAALALELDYLEARWADERAAIVARLSAALRTCAPAERRAVRAELRRWRDPWGAVRREYRRLLRELIAEQLRRSVAASLRPLTDRGPRVGKGETRGPVLVVDHGARVHSARDGDRITLRELRPLDESAGEVAAFVAWLESDVPNGLRTEQVRLDRDDLGLDTDVLDHVTLDDVAALDRVAEPERNVAGRARAAAVLGSLLRRLQQHTFRHAKQERARQRAVALLEAVLSGERADLAAAEKAVLRRLRKTFPLAELMAEVA